jgi:hypothetical protein
MKEAVKIKFLKPKDFDFGENFEDYYLKVKDIRKGDTFYECERSNNIELTALENAEKLSEGWSCKVKNNQGEVFELFLSDKTTHHGPNLFWAPQYISQDSEQGVGYMIV